MCTVVVLVGVFSRKATAELVGKFSEITECRRPVVGSRWVSFVIVEKSTKFIDTGLTECFVSKTAGDHKIAPPFERLFCANKVTLYPFAGQNSVPRINFAGRRKNESAGGFQVVAVGPSFYEKINGLAVANVIARHDKMLNVACNIQGWPLPNISEAQMDFVAVAPNKRLWHYNITGDDPSSRLGFKRPFGDSNLFFGGLHLLFGEKRCEDSGNSGNCGGQEREPQKPDFPLVLPVALWGGGAVLGWMGIVHGIIGNVSRSRRIASLAIGGLGLLILVFGEVWFLLVV